MLRNFHKTKNHCGVCALLLVLSSAAYAQVQTQEPAFEMVKVQGGEFLMGSPENEFEHQKDEQQHKVRVNDFLMSRYEVTQADFEAVMSFNPSSHKGQNLPVENVSWFDAVRFCNELSRQNGLTPVYDIEDNQGRPSVSFNQKANGYRLPTEAEWEYAARAGTQTPFSTGENINSDQANYYGTYPYKDRPSELYRGETIQVGSFQPNAWGLYDMHGNVWEWCWDRYGAYSVNSDNNPTGAESGRYRVNRGGGFNDFGKHLRSAYRAAHNPENKTFNIGIRLVRNAQ